MTGDGQDTVSGYLRSREELRSRESRVELEIAEEIDALKAERDEFAVAFLRLTAERKDVEDDHATEVARLKGIIREAHVREVAGGRACICVDCVS
jgi:hypothetical protein